MTKRKFLKKIFSCTASAAVATVILYIELIMSFPTEILMFNGEAHNEKLGAGVTIGSIPENVCTYTAADSIIPTETGEYTAQLKLAGAIPYKKVRVRVTDSRQLIASGELIGLRIHNNGLIVLRTATIETEKGTTASPAAQAGIKAGDIITEINGVQVCEGSEVASLLKNERTTIKYLHNNKEHTVQVIPVCSKENSMPKLGIWVRDSTAGVGTLTYTDPDTLSYGALGHGISDSETGVMFNVKKGSIEKSRVISVKKGISGKPGEICGSFSSHGEIVGTINKNCEAGIFGQISADAAIGNGKFPIGAISQVTVGDAYILSTVGDKTQKYDIQIIRTMPFGSATKGLMIKITDKSLLEKTGGIVQGMSGSPILQNGRIVGAVTHVFVNDPTRGYGIFIENMLSEAEKIK